MRMKFWMIMSAALLMGTTAATTAQAFSLGSAARKAAPDAKTLFISERSRSLEPFAHVLFCTKQPSECRASGGRDTVTLTSAKFKELKRVNSRVNRQITPQNDYGAIGGDEWSLAPVAGDCEDFAITKRHELIRLGWPARALRLAQARTSWGEGHLVLVVRTSEGDLVLDSLTSRIRNWRETGLNWIMIQAAGNPRVWHSV
ncbi:transglutaminase-like cysteine peptidase [Rhizobium sp. FKL33]|uniref:transglutaminase-like cysteine peptidase n=1 Tax=Rhizobium sp. FKL33 TaxID=2562307 RepID=UPI001FEF6277|nr:transglutaminase-like cysteine peptidase [Rhizobium sp. FKL33]